MGRASLSVLSLAPITCLKNALEFKLPRLDNMVLFSLGITLCHAPALPAVPPPSDRTQFTETGAAVSFISGELTEPCPQPSCPPTRLSPAGSPTALLHSALLSYCYPIFQTPALSPAALLPSSFVSCVLLPLDFLPSLQLPPCPQPTRLPRKAGVSDEADHG